MTQHLFGAVFLAVTFPAAVTMTAWPYRAPAAPVMVAQPVIQKDQSRMTQGTPLVRFVPVERIKPMPVALAELVTTPLPCEAIRKAVEAYGEKAVRAAAKERGYTKKQIDEAMRCLAEKKS